MAGEVTNRNKYSFTQADKDEANKVENDYSEASKLGGLGGALAAAAAGTAMQIMMMNANSLQTLLKAMAKHVNDGVKAQ